MNSPVRKPLLCSLLLSILLSTSGYTFAGESLTLKQTMKQMRLEYKQALESRSAESFNQHIGAFKEYLDSAQGYDFSPERKAVSLEGLNKVEHSIDEFPLANADNLTGLQQQLQAIDLLRKEYHKKAKPGVWEMLLSMFE